MSSLPVDFTEEKMDYLMKKLDLRLLTKDEARELVPLVNYKLESATKSGNKEHAEVWTGLLDVFIQPGLSEFATMKKVSTAEKRKGQ